jgi:hypothetical protein
MKKIKYDYWKAWYNRPGNREHFNDLMRERSRLHQRKIRKERTKKGLCTRCGGKRDMKFNHGGVKKTCSKCAKKLNKLNKK